MKEEKLISIPPKMSLIMQMATFNSIYEMLHTLCQPDRPINHSNVPHPIYTQHDDSP